MSSNILILKKSLFTSKLSTTSANSYILREKNLNEALKFVRMYKKHTADNVIRGGFSKDAFIKDSTTCVSRLVLEK